VNKRIALVGRFKNAYQIADKKLASYKARWAILFTKPLNKWTPHL